MSSAALPDCGHWPLDEAPKALRAALGTFLAAVEGRLTVKNKVRSRGPACPRTIESESPS